MQYYTRKTFCTRLLQHAVSRMKRGGGGESLYTTVSAKSPTAPALRCIAVIKDKISYCLIPCKHDPDDPCRDELDLHLQRVEERKKLRYECINKAKKDKSFLVLEFDNAQNYPLPLLNVSKQFYKRLLWLYGFNVHVFNNDDSYFYCFLKSQGQKNSNSVVSLVSTTIEKCITRFPEIRTVVLLQSDAAGGQNRNATMLKYCSWLSQTRGIKVVQVFPVRGHSFSQCDRNFGLVRQKTKKMEVIGTAKPWLEAIVQARSNPRPFELSMDADILMDRESALVTCFPKPPVSTNNLKPVSKREKFGIMQYVIIKYLPDDKLKCSSTYQMDYSFFELSSSLSTEDLQTLKLRQVPRPKVSQAKLIDVRGLLRYLPKVDQKWLNRILDDASPAD